MVLTIFLTILASAQGGRRGDCMRGHGCDEAWLARASSDSAYAHDKRTYHLPERHGVWLRLPSGRLVGATAPGRGKGGATEVIDVDANWRRR